MTNHNFFQGQETTPLKIRGLHLDISRHFIHPDMILRIIDKMADLKLNTLHLHLSDDQSFPVEFRKFPRFQSDPQLSILDQERIAKACKSRGIEIIPEIDIPGHVMAFLSFVDPEIQPEEKMGLITTEYINMERDLPVILGMFEELVERFDAKMIHMGGDEAHNYPRFPELVQKVCAWASKRGLEVIAWDDVLSFLEEVPENLICQRWRFRSSKKKKANKTILSWGYYLDHVDDPFTYYNREPTMFGEVEGAIACMWTELVDNDNIEATVFPQLYMIAHRWWNYPHKREDLPLLLKELCEEFGYPKADFNDWRARRWVGFYKDDPRSTSSVTIHQELNRPQDRYPVFSQALIQLCAALYEFFRGYRELSPEEKEMLLCFGQDCYQEDLSFLLEQKRGWKAQLNRVFKQKKSTSLLFHDRLKVAIRRALP